jgi:D-arabinose 1-dehydrogenase-like Zn-dependent alcohol dehydrogenase
MLEAIDEIRPHGRIGKPLELQEIPIPGIGDRDILVRVRAAGICHSDAHYRAGRSTMGNCRSPGT